MTLDEETGLWWVPPITNERGRARTTDLGPFIVQDVPIRVAEHLARCWVAGTPPDPSRPDDRVIDVWAVDRDGRPLGG